MRVADITPTWMTSVLQKAGHPAAEVTDLTVAGVGTGQVADSYRVTPAYRDDGDGAPGSVVVKLTPESDQSRATGRDQASYVREVSYYQHLAPSVGVRVPHCLYGEVDATGTEFVLVLEDLGPATQGDQIAGCSVERCETVVDQAALLHGPRWDDDSLRSHAWLDINEQFFGMAQQLLTAAFPVFRERYADTLGTDEVEVGATLVQRMSTYFERQRAMPWTIQHGD